MHCTLPVRYSTAYTHFYYLIVVIAGFLYGRKAIWAAFFFGTLHIDVSLPAQGTFPFDALLRALMLIIVAGLIGTVVEQMKKYQDLVLVQNSE